VTLASGDRLFVNVDANCMKMQFIGYVEGQTGNEPYGWNDGDVVFLNGTQVATLLELATSPHSDRIVVESNRPGTSGLIVGTNCDERGGVMMALVGDTCAARLNAPERVMLVEAIKSRLWRLFQ
jgi:hypothetical protein